MQQNILLAFVQNHMAVAHWFNATAIFSNTQNTTQRYMADQIGFGGFNVERNN